MPIIALAKDHVAELTPFLPRHEFRPYLLLWRVGKRSSTPKVMPLEKGEEPPTRRPALSRSSYSSFLFPRGLNSASSYRLATVVFLVATISFLGAGYHQQDRIQDYLSPPTHEHEGIVQPPITRLTDEEARLRAYEWKKPEPDESLLRHVANLSEVRAFYCLLRLRANL